MTVRRLLALPALLGAVLLAGCSGDAAVSGAPTARIEPRPEPVSEPEHRLPADPGLSDYLALAALRNPGLKAAWYRWQATRERAPQVRSLPDPMLRYGYFIREVETRVGPQRHRLGLSQRIPWPGKLVLAGQVADRAAAAERKREAGAVSPGQGRLLRVLVPEAHHRDHPGQRGAGPTPGSRGPH